MTNSLSQTMISELISALKDSQLQLATAESCTGGWVAKSLTDQAGSSLWFERGFVTYSNESKQEMLGVDGQLIIEQGAVSQQVAEAMATGALLNSHASVSLSITGIAGPGGGSDEKPVGLVWFAWAKKNKDNPIRIASEQQIFSGNRDMVREQAVSHSLTGLIRFLKNAE